MPTSLRHRLGDDASEGLQEMFADAYAQADEKYERRLTEEIGNVRLDIANLKFELLKWMFLFWLGQVAGIVALVLKPR